MASLTKLLAPLRLLAKYQNYKFRMLLGLN